MEESEVQRNQAKAPDEESAEMINQRTVEHLIRHLSDSANLDIVYSQKGLYFTMDFLRSEILVEVEGCGGRIGIHELQELVCVDSNCMSRAILGLLADCNSGAITALDGAFRHIGGEIISEKYLQRLFDGDVPRFIEEKGVTTISSIAKRFSLPMDLAGDLIRARISTGSINASIKRHTIVATMYDKAQLSKIKGICSGCTRAVPLKTIIRLLEADEAQEAYIIESLKSLIISGEIDGVFRGKTYLPAVCLAIQRACLIEFYEGNGYVEFSLARQCNFLKPAEEIKEIFPNCIILSNSAVDSKYVADLSHRINTLINDSRLVPHSAPRWPRELVGDHIFSLLPANISQVDALSLAEFYINYNAATSGINESSSPAKQNSVGRLNLAAEEKKGNPSLHKKGQVIILDEDACAVAELLSSLFASVDNAQVKENDDNYRQWLAEEMIQKMKQLRLASLHCGSAIPRSEWMCGSAAEGFGITRTKGSTSNEPIQLRFPAHFSSAADLFAVNRAKEEYEKAFLSESRIIDLNSQILDIVSPFFSSDRIHSLINVLLEVSPTNSQSGVPLAEMHAFIEAIWTNVKDVCIGMYIAEVNSFLCSNRNQWSDRGIDCKLEDERNLNFSAMWVQLQIVAKGLGTLEGRKIESYRPTKNPGPIRITELHDHVLHTRCAMISALLTMHATWNSAALPLISFENRITSLWELSDDCRAYIRKYIARDTAILLLNLWEICMNKDGNYSIWNFMDLIVSSASLKFTLVSSGSSKSSSLWTLDRKRERKTIAELIQSRVDSLRKRQVEFCDTRNNVGVMKIDYDSLMEVICTALSLCLYKASSEATFEVLPGVENTITPILVDVSVETCGEVLRRIKSGIAKGEHANEQAIASLNSLVQAVEGIELLLELCSKRKISGNGDEGMCIFEERLDGATQISSILGCIIDLF